MSLINNYKVKKKQSLASNNLFYNSPTSKTLLICHDFYSQDIILNDFIKNSKSGLSISAIVTNDPIGLLEKISKNYPNSFDIFDDDFVSDQIEINFHNGRTLCIVDYPAICNQFYFGRQDLERILHGEVSYIGYDNVKVTKEDSDSWPIKTKIKIICERSNISKFLFDEFISDKRHLEFMGDISFINSEV